MASITEDIVRRMREIAADTPFQFPPEAATFLQATFSQYERGNLLEAVFPLFPKYHNPAGQLMGGFHSAFYDLTMGPLCFLEAGKYAVSLDLNVSFHHAVPPGDTQVTVTAKLKERSKRLLFITGEARSSSGKLISTATSRFLIVQN